MTKEEWADIEKRLTSFYDIVKLKCDEYLVSLRLERIDNFKNGITVYVNGVMKGEWLMNESEEARRFFNKVTKDLISRKIKEEYVKECKKRRIKPDMSHVERKYSYYLPYWKSFKALKSSLIKNNAEIELVQ